LVELVKHSGSDQDMEDLIEQADFPYRLVQEPIASRIARKLQEMTGIEAQVTSLGHVQ